MILIQIAVAISLASLTSQETFQDFKAEMEGRVRTLASAMAEVFSKRCESSTYNCDIKSYNFCLGTSEKWCNPSFPPDQGCSDEGAYISRMSSVRFPSSTKADNLSTISRQYVCSSALIEDTYKLFDSGRDRKYTLAYIGFTSGVFREYPSIREASNGTGCVNYDPRFRPWYVAATTGPKNVIIIIDISGTMQGSKIYFAKNASTSIIKALGNVDFVGVVAFN